MARSRLPDATAEGRPLPRGPDAPASARQLLLRSWAGRLFIIATALKVLVAVIRLFGDLPGFVQVLSSAATIGLVISVGYFLWRLFILMKRRLLWRVRRKLILSYIFIGVVPALLIISFFMLGAWVISTNVSAYLFRRGYDDVAADAKLAAQGAATEIAHDPRNAVATIARVHKTTSQRYPRLSMAYIPSAAVGPDAARSGRWDHLPPPRTIPDWLRERSEGWSGTLSAAPESAGESELIIRAVAPSTDASRRLGFVVVDVPMDAEMLDKLYDATGVKAGSIRLRAGSSAAMALGSDAAAASNGQSDGFSLFGRGVAFLDATDWNTRDLRQATVSLTYRLSDLYKRLSRAQSAQISGIALGDAILLMLVVIAALFLVIEIAALVMGLALARSITSSIHELFMGTERVRHGDFTHRIDIPTKDQLGELADSFNQMTGSIENLLLTAAEKKRLEEELRIARQIQMSLLPRGPLDVAGLTITALCVPAREVGGDYYDFFPLGNGRLGVLIADVSGKGTSAALYMAELKGLMLSLSEIYQSPRKLLLEVNRIISENLDSRSFITMTYAVIDVPKQVMTFARAGHTPMIYLPAPGVGIPGARVLTPSGMVLGLRIDGAAEKFAELLEEDRIDIATGDVIVLYTDGITEAMNAESDLFGESRLGRIVEEHGHLDSGELRERILREIEAFVGAADQHDDMTMILLKVQQAGEVRIAV
ncbi:MAG: SpoIIE family protein phosphatase [Acidobacteria bacterium]|nr:SpoIIE family protein phosphatase [Acidobacteriota bacterium]